MYTSKELWRDRYGSVETSGTDKIKEYCFLKHDSHNNFYVKNLINDIYEIILDYIPDIIICNDLDFHPDHIMTSICFEKAMGKILKSKSGYCPLVLKGFCYENAYLGPRDFNEKTVKEMHFSCDRQGNITNNKYYSIKTGLNIDLKPIAYTRNLIKNRLYKSILKHKSQVLVEKAFALINPNVIYWKRNTNNIINKALINVSSGEKQYLNDFVLCDSTYILDGNKKKITYDTGIWIPDINDNEKSVYIDFKEKTYVDTLKIYIGNNEKGLIQNIKLYTDDKEQLIRNDKYIVEISIKSKIKNVQIKILDKHLENGFSEIELLDSNQDVPNEKNNFETDEKFSRLFNNIINIILVSYTKIIRKLFIKRRK